MHWHFIYYLSDAWTTVKPENRLRSIDRGKDSYKSHLSISFIHKSFIFMKILSTGKLVSNFSTPLYSLLYFIVLRFPWSSITALVSSHSEKTKFQETSRMVYLFLNLNFLADTGVKKTSASTHIITNRWIIKENKLKLEFLMCLQFFYSRCFPQFSPISTHPWKLGTYWTSKLKLTLNLKWLIMKESIISALKCWEKNRLGVIRREDLKAKAFE